MTSAAPKLRQSQYCRPNDSHHRTVKVKSEESQKIRAILVGRSRLVAIRRDIDNQVRSLIKEYGLLIPRAIGLQFRNQVCELLGEDHQLRGVIAPSCFIERRNGPLSRLGA